jgi:hypothetical protein
MKCALEVEDARAWWTHHPHTARVQAPQAFSEYWLGARSLPRTEVLLANLRARFDAFAPALSVLHRWPHMDADTRRLICHWHLQLSDPLYRRFTGEWLVQRRAGLRPSVTRDLVVTFMGEHGKPQWTLASRVQFASKLLSAAFAAGLVGSNRDPRPLPLPRVPDEALEYLLYLLRGVTFEGSLLANPYLASVGLAGPALDDRLRGLSALRFDRQGDLVAFDWQFTDLAAWAHDRLGPDAHLLSLAAGLPPGSDGVGP